MHRISLAITLTVAFSPPSVAEDANYPTFEPFTASRMWGVGFGPDSAQPADVVVSSLQELIRALSEPPRLPATPPEPADVALSKELSAGDRTLLKMLPWVFMQLEPLWEKAVWTEVEVSLAKAATDYVGLLDDAPTVSFRLGAGEANRQNLRRFVQWFRQQLSDPATYGSMIFTMDDGPWQAVDHPQEQVLPAVSTQRVGPELELRLCRLGGTPTRWCLQCVQGQDLLWTKLLTQVPGNTFDFTGMDPTDLGTYGWKVHMSFGEYVQVYLDRAGNLLFYFTSW